MLLGYTDDEFYQVMQQAYNSYIPLYISDSGIYIIDNNKATIVNCIRPAENFLYKIQPTLIDGRYGELYELNGELVYISTNKNITHLVKLDLDINNEHIQQLTQTKTKEPTFIISQDAFAKLHRVFYSEPVTVKIENDKLDAESWGNHLHLERESLSLQEKPITFNLALNEIRFIKDYATNLSIHQFKATLHNKTLILSLPHRKTIIKLSL